MGVDSGLCCVKRFGNGPVTNVSLALKAVVHIAGSTGLMCRSDIKDWGNATCTETQDRQPNQVMRIRRLPEHGLEEVQLK
jgi:hypothetical protein